MLGFQCYTRVDLGVMLRKSVHTIKRWERSGKLPFRPVPNMGRSRLYDGKEVDAWYAEQLQARETEERA